MLIGFFILIGAVAGSFINMLLWRLPEGKSIHGRSQCPSCDHQLAWYDLVPLLSFLALRGRCRYCNKSIPHRYLIVELVSAVIMGLFALFAVPDLTSLAIIVDAYAVIVLIALLFFDSFYLILPDSITIPAIVVTLAYDLFLTPESLGHLLTSLVSALLFAILYLASRGKWLGFGDVKLVALIGLIFGYPFGYLAIVGGIWLGAGLALSMLIAGTATRKKALPLGAFLCVASLILLIFHNELSFLEIFFR